MSSEPFYAVAVGRIPGVYRTWPACQEQTRGFPKAQFKKFWTLEEAQNFIGIEPPPSTPPPDESGALIVYTDGSGVGSIAGAGVHFPDASYLDVIETIENGTNNIGELTAIKIALELTSDDPRHLIIRSDSEYGIKALTVYFDTWKANGFRKADGKPVANLALILSIKALMENREVSLIHARAHCGEPGNERADRLAGLASGKYR